jgi:hypothetical protein
MESLNSKMKTMMITPEHKKFPGLPAWAIDPKMQIIITTKKDYEK